MHTLRAVLAVGAGFALASGVAAQNRTITLVNQCTQTIWVGALNIPNQSVVGWELPASCQTSADCPQPSFGTAACTNQKCVVTLTVPTAKSLNFWPRTGCKLNSNGLCPNTGQDCCDTGGCTNSGAFGLACNSGGVSPLTLAELSLQTGTNNDFYDVSSINGYNVPVQITPSGGTACPSGFGDCRYWCSSPGNPTAAGGLQGCSWSTGYGSTCGNPILRTVALTGCASNSDCPAGTTCNLGFGACTCTSDSQCGTGQICGVARTTAPGFLACGQMIGCASHLALCGLYTGKQTGGGVCQTGGDCASGACVNNTCQSSGVDSIATFCNTAYANSLSCTTNANCPALVGYQPAQCSGCPAGTTCQQDSNGNNFCRPSCVSGKCAQVACTTNADCLSSIPGTFMLCQNGACVSTNASLFSTTGINGQSCYALQGASPAPDVTTQCGGCPTDPANPLSNSWPTTSTKCNSNNPNWVSAVMPEAKTAKAACPTSYSFPFDDPTSTFQCSNSGTTNTVGYTITFCP
jgi:hypothetical protein